MVLRLLAIVIERQVMFCSLGRRWGRLVRNEPIGKINSFACYDSKLSLLSRLVPSRGIFERVSKFSLFRTPLSRYVSSFHAAHVKSRSSGFRERSMERCFSARESRNKFRFFFFSPPLFFHLGTSSG